MRVATIAVNGPFMAKTKDRYHDSLETNVIVTDTSVTVAPVSFATILAIRRFDSRFFGVEKRCYLNDEVLIVKQRTTKLIFKENVRF